MKPIRITTLVTLGLSLILLLAACAPAGEPTLASEESNLATQVAIKNTTQPFDVAALSGGYYLSVEVEVTQEGVRPLSASVIQGPPVANSAIPDLQVQVWTAKEMVSQYTLADPRLVEVEGEGQIVLDQSTTYTFAPLTADLHMLQVVPVGEAESPAALPEDYVDLKPWMRTGCLSATQLSVCKQILETIRGARLVLAGQLFEREIIQQMVLLAVPWKNTARVFKVDTPIAIELIDGTVLNPDARTQPSDRELASKYFAEAGLESGQPISIYYAQEDDQLAQVARLLAESLSALKLKPAIKPLPLIEIQKSTEAAAEGGESFLWLTW